MVAFRRDIQVARLNHGIADLMDARAGEVELPTLGNTWACPWVRLMCIRSGKPVPYRECADCDFRDCDSSEASESRSEAAG